jgi:hypothetical protein
LDSIAQDYSVITIGLDPDASPLIISLQDDLENGKFLDYLVVDDAKFWVGKC